MRALPLILALALFLAAFFYYRAAVRLNSPPAADEAEDADPRSGLFSWHSDVFEADEMAAAPLR